MHALQCPFFCILCHAFKHMLIVLACRLGATGLSLTSTVALVGLARPALDGNNLHMAHHADRKAGID